MANDLAWYHFDRAVCAHMRGDDAVALADARALTALQKAVEAKAEAMGFAHPRRLVDRGEGPAPYIDFLGQLPEFLADHERRAREPKRPPMPPPGADKKARIAALIADLDQVFARAVRPAGGRQPGRIADRPGPDRRGRRGGRAPDRRPGARHPPDPRRSTSTATSSGHAPSWGRTRPPTRRLPGS